MSDARDVKFWECGNDEETLSHTTIAAAVEAWAAERYPTPLPETVMVFGFAPMELPSAAAIADRLLDGMREWLDDEYGDQFNGKPTKIPDSVTAAAAQFAETFRAQWPVWSCEQITHQSVRVADYVTADDSRATHPSLSQDTE